MADGGLQGLIEAPKLGPIGRQLVQRGERDPLAAIMSELLSGADRLRPPYATPILGADPRTAGAATNAEVGFSRLPGAYQRAFAQMPSKPLAIGAMPSGCNASGATFDQGRSLLADTPQTMAHELIHELGNRMAAADPGANRPWGGNTEEELARLVAGDPVQLGASVRQSAEEADAAMRQRFTPPAPNESSSMIGALLRYLGIGR